MSVGYWELVNLSLGVWMWVEFTTVRGKMIDCAVVLALAMDDDSLETIRVYDGSHGFNEMHRYVRSGGKQIGIEVHSGNLGEGMRAAIRDIKAGYLAMIEGWER